MPNISQTFRPISDALDSNEGYTSAVLLRETSGALLYRVQKAGKYFIIKTPSGGGMWLDMIKREYNIALGLSHQNIINIFTYESSTPVGPGIVMEYIDGVTLREWLLQNPSLKTRHRVFLQILDAVEYIHKSSIIHNDLKPDNIMITRVNADAKLIDFGLSDNDAHYLLRTLGCSPHYASHELQNHSNTIDARSDIYSLGVMLQEMFGKKYAAISHKCMQHDPARRYQNISDLRQAFLRQINQWKTILTATVAAIVLTGILGITALYINSKQALNQYIAITESTEAEYQSHLTQADEIIQAAFTSSLDSIEKGTYSKRSRAIPINFISTSQTLCRPLLEKIDNERVKTLITDHAEGRQYALQQQLNTALTQRINSVRDSLLKSYQTAVNKAYSLTLDSIHKSPYSEFAWIHMKYFTVKCQHILNSILSSTDDDEISNWINSSHKSIFMPLCTDLADKCYKLEAIFNRDLSPEEQNYYQKLLDQKKPFKPYQGLPR